MIYTSLLTNKKTFWTNESHDLHTYLLEPDAHNWSSLWSNPCPAVSRWSCVKTHKSSWWKCRVTNLHCLIVIVRNHRHPQANCRSIGQLQLHEGQQVSSSGYQDGGLFVMRIVFGNIWTITGWSQENVKEKKIVFSSTSWIIDSTAKNFEIE